MILPYASRAAATTGIPVSVIMAQWGIESAYGTSQVYQNNNNLGGIKHVSSSIDIGVSPSGYAKYSDLNQFTQDYIRVMHNGYYDKVLKAGNKVDAAYALGDSSYAEGKYRNGDSRPGSSILWTIQNFGLDKYDGLQVAEKYPLSVDIDGLRSQIASMPDEQKNWYAAIGFALVGAYLLLK
jgi:flagellum-specific peptidoglycan hydrolase FlgJ